MLKQHSQAIRSICYPVDGGMVVSGGNDGLLNIWDGETKKLTKTYYIHATGVFDAIFLPENKRVISCGDETEIAIVDISCRKVIQKLKCGENNPLGIAVSSDRRDLFLVDNLSTISTWDIETGHKKRSVVAQVKLSCRTAFSPVCRTVMLGGDDALLWLLELESGKPLRHFAGHKGKVSSVAFSPDARTALSGDSENVLWLWDLANGQGRPLHSFAGHGYVMSICFSPDGKFAISGGLDGVVRLWNLESRQLVKNFVGHEGPVLSAIFSSDGRSFLSGGYDLKLRQWDASTGECVIFRNGEDSRELR